MRQTVISFLLPAIFCSYLGCSDSKNTYPTIPADARAKSFVRESKPFKIGSDSYNADFGTMTVRENRSDSTSRLISIPFLRIHSPSAKPAEPIFAFAGGPGESNMWWNRGVAAMFLPEHDFVLVGYRGVDGSTVLDCPEVAKALTKEDDPLTEESMKRIGQAWSESAQRLMSAGIDLSGYSMLDCIDDNESVCKVLGYQRIDLLSASYGTRIAYLYGLKYPERIFRSAMIAANPPGHFAWRAGVIDTQLRHYSALWLKDSMMVNKSPDLYGAMRRVLNNMPGRWLVFSINPGKVRIVTFTLLFQRKTAAMVFDAYIAADRGDASGLALMSMMFDYVMPSLMTWGDLATKAVSADFDSARNYRDETDSSSAPLGSPLSRLLWGPAPYSSWPTELLPEQFRKPQRSDVQTLILSGSVDFSTPAEIATDELLPYLNNGKQVTLSECGHFNDLLFAQPENSRLLLTSFFKTGVPNTSKNSYLAMDFNVAWGFPAVAKLAVAAIVILGIALVGVVVWIARKYLKRKAATSIVSREVS